MRGNQIFIFFAVFQFFISFFAGCDREHSESKNPESPPSTKDPVQDANQTVDKALSGIILNSLWQVQESLYYAFDSKIRVFLSPEKNILSCAEIRQSDSSSEPRSTWQRLVQFDFDLSDSAKIITFPDQTNQYIYIWPKIERSLRKFRDDRIASSGVFTFKEKTEKGIIGKLKLDYNVENSLEGAFTSLPCM